MKAAADLKYLVFDELHTYRGRQGADVAMLIRRARNRMGGAGLQCIGTSATMSSQGGAASQRAEVARVASKVFGSPVAAEHVVGETLKCVTPEIDFDEAVDKARLAASIHGIDALLEQPYATFVADPLCSWVESAVGVHRDHESGALVRAKPRRLTGDEGLDDELAGGVRRARGHLPPGAAATPAGGVREARRGRLHAGLRVPAASVHRRWRRRVRLAATPGRAAHHAEAAAVRPR